MWPAALEPGISPAVMSNHCHQLLCDAEFVLLSSLLMVVRLERKKCCMLGLNIVALGHECALPVHTGT